VLWRCTSASPGSAAVHHRLAARSGRDSAQDTPPPRAFCRASPFFSQHILQHGLVQRQVCDDLLELAILFLELFEPTQLREAQARELPFPGVERLLADSYLAAQLRNRSTGLSKSNRLDDLLLT
jgi:hypothetical protein